MIVRSKTDPYLFPTAHCNMRAAATVLEQAVRSRQFPPVPPVSWDKTLTFSGAKLYLHENGLLVFVLFSFIEASLTTDSHTKLYFRS